MSCKHPLSALKVVNIDRITAIIETTSVNIIWKKSNAEFCRDFKLKRKWDNSKSETEN